MSEQEPAPAEAQATPEQTEQPTQEQIDWQKRYGDLQPEYTRATQEASELRRQNELYQHLLSEDPDTRKAAAEALGYEVEEEAPTEYLDPNDELRRELDQIKQTLSQQSEHAQAQASQQRDVETIGAGLAEMQNNLGRDLTEDEVQLLGDAAMMRRNEQGLPDIKSVVEQFSNVRISDQKTWGKSKKAPHISPLGAAGTDAPNLDDQGQRIAAMTERFNTLSNED